MIKRLLLTVMLGIVAMSGFAQFNGGGSGTSSDPYVIYNASQLDQVRNFLNDENVCFKLGADIDLKSFIAGENPIQGWLPIGSSAAPFMGTFDGNGKTISNLTITRATTDYVGLFGHAGSATIKDLTIKDSKVTGQNYTGALVGLGGALTGITINATNVTGVNYTGCVGGSIKGATTTKILGTVVVRGADYVGCVGGNVSGNVTSVTIPETVTVSGKQFVAAIAGHTTGAITLGSVTMSNPSVTGTSSVALLAGKADDDVTITQPTIQGGTVTASGDYAALLVGSAAKAVSVSNATVSNTTVTATAGNYVSGCVGKCEGLLTMNTANFTTTKLSGNDYVGIAAGYAGSASIDGVNSIGTDVKGKLYVGGLIGMLNIAPGTQTTVVETDLGEFVVDKTAVYYYNSDASREGKIRYTAAEKNDKINSTYVPEIYCTNPNHKYWHLHYNNTTRKVNVNYQGKNLLVNCNVDGILSSDGYSGSIVGEMYIADNNVVKTTTKSTSTTDLGVPSGVTAQYYLSIWSAVGRGFENNITTEETHLYDATPSNISSCKSNLNIASTGIAGGIIGQSCIATFSNCDYRGNIKGTNIGGIVGVSKATTIEKCHSYGSLISSGTDTRSVGGIVAQQDTLLTLSNCFSSMDIKGGHYSGGMVGTLAAQGTINDSYFSGNILNSTSYAGGIVGYNTNTSSAINRCYSHSHLIAATQKVGGIVGEGSLTAKSCASINDIISVGADGSIYRIMPSGTAGATGTTAENKAWVMTTMKKNGVALELPADDAYNGTSVGTSTLKTKATYLGMGWTFDDKDWLILNTESFPYLLGQTAPPYITSDAVEGMTKLTGRAVEDGTIYVTVGDDVYTTTSANNQWSVSIKALAADAFIGVSAQAAEKRESYPSFTSVEKATGPIIEVQEGEGTAESPFLITSANQLQSMKSGDYYYKLANDIDVTDWIAATSTTDGWLPIGTYSNGISFIEFDGDGKTIKGLWCNRNIEAVGLFGNIIKGDVKNLKVETASGKSLKGGSSTKYLGGLAGIMTGNLENDSVNVVVTTGTNASTLVGKITGNITGSYAQGSATGSTEVGGLAGYITGEISNSSASSSITSANRAGGIAGYADGMIENVDYEGDVTVTGTSSTAMVGGIAGYALNGISKSHANATISGGFYVGGAAGHSKGAITETYTEGEITTSVDAAYAAGIVGKAEGGVSDCYTMMTVTATADDSYATGIASYNTKTVTRCYSLGNIAGYKASGIVNINYGSSAIISNNAALCPTINGKNVALRVLCSFANGAPEPNQSNKAIDNMAVSVNNVPQVIYDDPMNGYAFPEASAKTETFYTSLNWDFEDVWTMGESGYPELKCFAAGPATPDFIVGDVNNDGNITMSDVVSLISHIMGTTLDGFNANAADINGDTEVKLSDVVLLIDKIMGKTSAQAAPRRANAFLEAGELYAANYNADALTLGLSNATSMTAVQMDIVLPEGVEMENIGVSSKHIATWTRLSSGKTRIMIYSPSNKNFEGNNIATLHLTGNSADKGMTIEAISECAANGKEFDLANLELGGTTAIRNVHNENEPMNVVTISGQSLGKRDLRSLTPGVYVVNGKKYIIK